MQIEAFNYYKKNTMSIEILKDSNLQKVNFRVKNKVIIFNSNFENAVCDLGHHKFESVFDKKKTLFGGSFH